MAMFRFEIMVLLLVNVALAADGKLESLEEQAFKQAAALVDPSLVRIETVGGLELSVRSRSGRDRHRGWWCPRMGS